MGATPYSWIAQAAASTPRIPGSQLNQLPPSLSEAPPFLQARPERGPPSSCTCMFLRSWKISMVRYTMFWTVSCPIRQSYGSGQRQPTAQPGEGPGRHPRRRQRRVDMVAAASGQQGWRIGVGDVPRRCSTSGPGSMSL